LRYVGIVSANLDEFFMVRVSALKRLALEGTGERSMREPTPDEQLADLRTRIEQLVARQERAAQACFTELRAEGMRLVRLEELEPSSRLQLREYFSTSIQPALTPQA